MNFSLTPLTLGDMPVGQFAFDGKYYYFTLFCQEKIIQTREDFCPIGTIHTGRAYDCLCFDQGSCCFWASISGSATRLFQLDCQMREIGCVCLSHELGGKITGLSYHSCDDSLFVAYATGVGIYEKKTQDFHVLPPVMGLITAVLVICPAYLLVTRRGKVQTLHYFFDNGEKIRETSLPEDCAVQDLCYNPCHCATPRLDILLREHSCYPNMSSVPVTAYELGFEPCICNHKICQHCCCATGPATPVEDVLESIALVEAALSHILNAQGEELQRVVAESCSVDEMLEVNSQINKTITKVTHLEQVLYGKLEELNEIASKDCFQREDCCHKLSSELIE